MLPQTQLYSNHYFLQTSTSFPIISKNSSTSRKNKRLEDNKQTQLKDTPIPWTSSNLHTKRQESILAHLRLGHTRPTHTHLLTHLMPLSCPHCDNDLPFIVDHLFDCFNLTSLHNSYNIPTTVAQTLLTINPLFFTYSRTYVGSSVSFPAFNSFHSILRAHSPNYLGRSATR